MSFYRKELLYGQRGGVTPPPPPAQPRYGWGFQDDEDRFTWGFVDPDTGDRYTWGFEQ